MAFKKSKQKSQPDLFATASFSLPERERRYMEDEHHHLVVRLSSHDILKFA